MQHGAYSSLSPNDDVWDSTFSIIAVDSSTGEMGGAVATRRPAVGARIPVIRPRVGVIASQAVSNAWLSHSLLDLLARGIPPQAALAAGLAMDPSPAYRQIHIINSEGISAAYTGESAPEWHGSVVAAGVSIAANHVVGAAVIEDMLGAFQSVQGDLAERLVSAIEAGERAGGDARGKQSSAVAVNRGEPFPWIDLRVDDHPEPVQELRRLLTLYREQRTLRDRPRAEFLKGG
jgi:uncharacterized Ntn-hydrolase superfamily protein